MTRRRKISNLEAGYVAGLSQEEAKRHFSVRRFPSGRNSRGGANRSANLKRVIDKKTLTVTLCPACGGVSPEVAALTSLFPLCLCA